MPFDEHGMWGYWVPVPPGLPLEAHYEPARAALLGLAEGLRLQNFKQTGRPRLEFVRGNPELLLPGEQLTHRWCASAPYRPL